MRSTAFVACAVIVACSCSDKSATEKPVSTTTITSAPVTLVGPSDDQLILRAEAAVSADRALSMAAAGVEIDVTEGIATLRGATPDPEALRAIEDVVARVPGIVTTLNKVEVRTPSQEERDDMISFSLQRALLLDPAVASRADRVTIEVKDGSVTLRGMAGDPRTRAAVERVVDRTPGVLTVKNLLAVTSRE